jgi:23S rRNA (adenine-N6)-dimethyltransferase
VTASPRPSIRYSQNFLTDPRLVGHLIEAAGIGPDDLVLEIGPGRGIITEQLARRCRRVLAVEIDPALARRLAQRFAADPRVEVRTADVLDCTLPAERYRVFANIPFNRTAAIIGRLTGAARAPDDQCLIVQREAAARFCGRPVTTLRSLLLAPWFESSVLVALRRSDFSPPPAVETVLLRIARREVPLVTAEHASLYRDFVVAVFTSWQGSIGDALRQSGGRDWAQRALTLAEVDDRLLPSAVPSARWLALFDTFNRCAPLRAHAAVRGAEARLLREQSHLHKLHRTRRTASGPGPPRCRRKILRRGGPIHDVAKGRPGHGRLWRAPEDGTCSIEPTVECDHRAVGFTPGAFCRPARTAACAASSAAISVISLSLSGYASGGIDR